MIRQKVKYIEYPCLIFLSPYKHYSTCFLVRFHKITVQTKTKSKYITHFLKKNTSQETYSSDPSKDSWTASAFPLYSFTNFSVIYKNSKGISNNFEIHYNTKQLLQDSTYKGETHLIFDLFRSFMSCQKFNNQVSELYKLIPHTLYSITALHFKVFQSSY